MKSKINHENKSVQLYADEPEQAEILLNQVDLDVYGVGLWREERVGPMEKWRKADEASDVSWLAKHKKIRRLGYNFTDFNVLYQLPNLEILYLPDMAENDWKTKNILDFSRLTKLKELHASWHKCMTNIGACPNLEELHLWHYTAKDFSDLGRSPNLRKLKLIQAKTKTLDGMTGLQHLKRAEFYYCRSLHNIDALSYCPNLEFIYIEKCAKLLDYQLASNSLKHLALDRVSNLEFIKICPNLNRLYFRDLKDGNLQPILDQFHSSEQVGMFPAKQPHYQYSEKELHALLDKKTK